MSNDDGSPLFAYAGSSALPMIAFQSSMDRSGSSSIIDASPYMHTVQRWASEVRDTDLFPYMRYRAPKGLGGWFRRRIVASAIIEAFASIAIFQGIAVINTILWQYQVYGRSWFTKLETLDTFSSPLTLFVILIIAVLPTVLLIVYEYYVGSVRKYLDILDRVRISSDLVPRYLLDRRHDWATRQQQEVQYSIPSGVVIQVPFLDLLSEAGQILKTIPYAVKYRYRLDGKLFDPRLLPLPRHLHQELLVFSATTTTNNRNRYLESLLNMYQKRISALFDGDPSSVTITPPATASFYTIQEHITRISESIKEIFITREIWAGIERFVDIVQLSLWVWLVYLPLRLLPVFGLWTLLWFLIPNVIANGLFISTTKRLNPFNDLSDNTYVFYDLGAWGHETAEHIDRAFALATYEREKMMQKR